MKNEKKLQKRKLSEFGEKLIVSLEVDKDVLMYYGSADMGILYSNIRFWCLHNEDKQEETHFHDGVWWTYNTGKSFAKSFPFWKIRTIYRMLDTLEKDGFIRKDNFNKMKFDRTNWYSIVEKDSILAFVKSDKSTLQKMTNASTTFDNTIPDSKLQIDKLQIDANSIEQRSIPVSNLNSFIPEDILVKENKHNYSSSPESDIVSTPSPLQSHMIETPVVDFVWNDYLNKMLIDPKKHIVFIAKYFKVKHITFASQEAVSAAIIRNVKIAKKLITSFTNDELNWSVKYCRNSYDRKGLTWNLDTLLKVISTVPMTDDGKEKIKRISNLPENSFNSEEFDKTIKDTKVY